MDECRFAGDVEVMGTCGDTCLDHGFAVPVEGTGGVDQDGGLGGHGFQRLKVSRICPDTAHLHISDLLPQLLQLLDRSTGDGKTEPFRGLLLCQPGCHQPACKTGGTKQNDIIGTCRHRWLQFLCKWILNDQVG